MIKLLSTLLSLVLTGLGRLHRDHSLYRLSTLLSLVLTPHPRRACGGCPKRLSTLLSLVLTGTGSDTDLILLDPRFQPFLVWF